MEQARFKLALEGKVEFISAEIRRRLFQQEQRAKEEHDISQTQVGRSRHGPGESLNIAKMIFFLIFILQNNGLIMNVNYVH